MGGSGDRGHRRTRADRADLTRRASNPSTITQRLCEHAVVSHGRGHLDDVELVEDGRDGRAEHVAGDRAVRSVARWGRRHRRSLLVGVVVVALAAGGAQWVRASAARARLEATSGVVRTLAAPWHTAWQAGAALLGVSAPSGTVLVTGNDGHVAALDPTSGQVLWTTSVEPPEGSPQCLLTSPEASSGGLTAPGGQPEYVVCTRAGGAVCTGLSAPGDTAAPGSSGVSTGSCVEIDAIAQVLDVRTGRVLRTIDLAWSSFAAAMVDGDLVAAGLDADGRLGAARWRLSGTDPVWRYLGARMGAGGTPAVVARGRSWRSSSARSG